MKRKLLFSCEKEGLIFCTAICRHLPPLTRHTENWFCFKVAAPSPACQSVADMSDLWMKPESMKSVSSLHCRVCLPVNVRHAGKHQMKTSQQVMWDMRWFEWKKKKSRAEKDYIFTVTTAHCSVVTALHLQHVFAIKWPCSVEHKRNARIWIYHMATREPYVSFEFRRPFWTNRGVG